ncbi:MAG: sigma-54 dependent transcriptional regulator [Victivallaceae bacterium]|nr:sigma-54 dependent transcriptional regulator [Victivallaceae bacterium]
MKKNLYPAIPVLIVDDEAIALKSYELAFLSAGINNVILCDDGRDALRILGERDVEMVILDMIMENVSGTEVLEAINHEYPDVPVIIVTGVNDINTAVECIKMGAMDYFLKPVDTKKLINQVRNSIEIRDLKRENIKLRNHLLTETPAKDKAFSKIVTRNRYMLSLFQYCAAIAQSSQPVLITGETGAGKELFAQAIHTLSNASGKFVAVNIAGFDDNILSDTLFGHERGAFTGADRKRRGLVEQADNGSLFLDEIGDLNMASQIKLLRLLQEREFTALGADKSKHSNARVILATHRELSLLQHSQDFRRDLYYRISTHHIHVPPLREHKDDIQLLVEHFLVKASRELKRKPPTYPPELIILLKSYHFPGNIRELEAMVFDAVSNHRAKMLSTKIFREHISRNSSEPIQTDNFKINSENWARNLEMLPSLKDTALALVKEAMWRTGGNQSVAARMLGITPQALSSRLKRGKEKSGAGQVTGRRMKNSARNYSDLG